MIVVMMLTFMFKKDTDIDLYEERYGKPMDVYDIYSRSGRLE